MELNGDLSEQGRARVLRNMGERTRGSETNESDLPIPSEILDRCRVLKQQWTDAHRDANDVADEFQTRTGASSSITAFAGDNSAQADQVGRRSAATFPHQRAKIFVLNRTVWRLGICRLPALVGLTRREQEVAQLVCQGRSNQEVADNARLSLPMVKKHLHAVFRKLQVPSRTRLVTLAT